MSARVQDLNGWYESKGNPISKVGVFPYLGAQLPDAPDPGRIYQVYRPAEELGRRECLESFKLIPFIDEHTMLGPSDSPGLTPAEQKGVHGVVGEEVEFDGTYIRGNLKVFSEAMANLITRVKKELSAGYRCLYDWTPGITPDGVRYDAVQRDIRANHLALVAQGRMGPDVAVLDHFTIDSMEYTAMPDPTENKDGDLASIKAALESLAPLLAQVEEIKASLAGAAMKKEEEAPAEMSDEQKAEKAKADAAMLDAQASEQLAAMDARLKATEASLAKVTDSADIKTVLAHVQKRDALVAKVTPFIGVFDSALMTVSDVAKYAADKLELNAPAGAEEATLHGYLHGRAPSVTTVATDSAVRGSLVANYLAGK